MAIGITDEQLRERLEWFRDLKLGIMFHWGPYSQWGCIESWPLSEEDTWARPGWKGDIAKFKKDYWDLNKTFNPVNFDPEGWAKLAADAGFRYIVFTTKHHDGFNMYDTHLTDYKITAPDCPFHTSPRADVTKAVFDAFRAEGLAVGAYYSKADWHSPYYWAPDRPATNRNPNYDTQANPELWQGFVDFVHGQIRELMAGYGPIDILWLDAGQVRPPLQDIDMDGIVEVSRQLQPGLIVADRTVGGPHENYLTPEQEVPPQPLARPWETCMTMGDQWSYKPDDIYKSPKKIIHLLIDVVAKGGNLLLNIGPSPDGRLPSEGVERVLALGEWMKVNGEAIYGTRVCPPYKKDNIALTQKGSDVYAFYMLGEENVLPSSVTLPVNPGDGAMVELLGVPQPLGWTRCEEGICVGIPHAIASAPPSLYACAFRVRNS